MKSNAVLCTAPPESSFLCNDLTTGEGGDGTGSIHANSHTFGFNKLRFVQQSRTTTECTYYKKKRYNSKLVL